VRAKHENANEADLSEKRGRQLAAGVLKQAARDLRRFRSATCRRGRELYLDAHRWVMADHCSWPFSFLNVCHALSLEPESVRRELMSDLSSGTFRYWTRRCGRAARRSRLSLTQFFGSHRRIEAGDGIFAKPISSIAI
jgi:hypothetical protein